MKLERNALEGVRGQPSHAYRSATEVSARRRDIRIVSSNPTPFPSRPTAIVDHQVEAILSRSSFARLTPEQGSGFSCDVDDAFVAAMISRTTGGASFSI